MASAANSIHTQRIRPRADDTVNIIAPSATMDIQRHGNWTNRNSGKYRQKIMLIGSIKTIATAESANIATKTPDFRVPEVRCEPPRHAAIAAQTAHKIRRLAMCDAIRLKASCSTSLVFAYRKLSAGVSPP